MEKKFRPPKAAAKFFWSHPCVHTRPVPKPVPTYEPCMIHFCVRSNTLIKMMSHTFLKIIRSSLSTGVWYIISIRMLLRTQKCIIHVCMLSKQLSMIIYVLHFGGQLVHLDMATWVSTSSRGRSGFDPGHPNGIICSKGWAMYVIREI